MTCVLHQLQLIVKKLLVVEQVCEYLRRLATLTKVWRSSGTAWKIRHAWSQLFGADAARSCSTLPQRPLKGRWGYIHNCEEFFVGLHHHQLSQVFAAVFMTGSAPRRRKSTAESAVCGR